MLYMGCIITGEILNNESYYAGENRRKEDRGK